MFGGGLEYETDNTMKVRDSIVSIEINQPDSPASPNTHRTKPAIFLLTA